MDALIQENLDVVKNKVFSSFDSCLRIFKKEIENDNKQDAPKGRQFEEFRKKADEDQGTSVVPEK